MKCLQPVDRAEDIGEEHRYRPADQLVDEQFIDEQLGGGCGLTTAAQRVHDLRNGLKAPAVALQREAERAHVKRHGLEATLKHQGAGHAGIVAEVALKEPVVGSKAPLGPQVATLPGAA